MILLTVVQNTIPVFFHMRGSYCNEYQDASLYYLTCRNFGISYPDRNVSQIWRKQDPRDLFASQFGSSGRLSASELY
jgi:hypothetical protein